MNIAAYLTLVDLATAELAKVRSKLEQVQAGTSIHFCAPIMVSPIGWDCDGPSIALMPDDLRGAFDEWLAVIGDKLAHPPGDDA